MVEITRSDFVLVIIAFSVCSIAYAEDVTRYSFDGEGRGVTPDFSVDGPWTMDWSTTSDYFLTSGVTIRLYDSNSGELIGRIAEIDGAGHGFKHIEEPGSYRIEFAGMNFDWQVQITQISEEESRNLIQRSIVGPSLADVSRSRSQRVPEGSFTEWRPVNDGRLLLLHDGSVVWNISFAANCPGLRTATAISFVTPATNGFETYDSILLDNGTRCYFESVVPENVP